LLNQHRVKYLIIGGYAVAYHGHPRYTGDIDFFVALSEANAKALVKVFKAFGFTDPPPAVELFLKPGNIVRIGREPMRLEVLNEIDGVSFAECWEKRLRRKLDGLMVNLIHLEDLRRNKGATGRPKDQDDLIHLPVVVKK
jgi:predicted nucleotidyltransferase